MNWIGANVKTIRRVRDWTQQQLADRLHVSRSRVGSWEENRSKPNYEDLVKLAELCSIEDATLLMTEEYKPGNLIKRKVKSPDEILRKALSDIKNILNSLPAEYL